MCCQPRLRYEMLRAGTSAQFFLRLGAGHRCEPVLQPAAEIICPSLRAVRRWIRRNREAHSVQRPTADQNAMEFGLGIRKDEHPLIWPAFLWSRSAGA